MESRDEHYLDTFLSPIRSCARYVPKFGVGTAEAPVDLAAFKIFYGSDPLYSWIGLDSDLMYAAHKAAGGMTSIYRQVGIGCERLFRAIVQDQLSLSSEDVLWGYDAPAAGERSPRLTLDARIELSAVRDSEARSRVSAWLKRSGKALRIVRERRDILCGAVFEVRQGYKSADSKRQNADLRFGLMASAENYLPVVLVFSNQISQVVAERYRSSSLMVLTGVLQDDDTLSTYAFCDNVLQYSLAAFFKRNSKQLKTEVQTILAQLLSGT